MNYEQNIPFYIHAFESYPWKVFTSEHYIFHVEKNSLAEKEIENIKLRQEKAYRKIIDSLSLPESDKKIRYYFYPSQKQKEKLMGDSWYGQSIYEEYAIHAVYSEKDKVIGEHEDTHLLTLQLGLPISLFQEGLAEHMVGKSMFGNQHNDVIRDGVSRGIDFNLETLMSQQGWLSTPDDEAEFYYSVAGSFIAFLSQDIGIDLLKVLYVNMDRKNTDGKNIELFESVTGKKFKEIETAWLQIIRTS